VLERKVQVIAWRAWPVRRSPAKGVLALGVVAGSVWGVIAWTGDPWMTVLAAAVLAVSVAPFFVPTSYRLSEEGVEIHRPWRTKRRSWTDFRRVLAGRNLLVLTPFEKRTWLETIRGETLLIEDNRGEVLEYVEAMVGGQAGLRDAGQTV
jgi:hypothetical protein